MLCKGLKFVSINTFEKQAVEKRHGRFRPGRARPGRAIKTNLFCSMDNVPIINTKRDMPCCELPYVTIEGGS